MTGATPAMGTRSGRAGSARGLRIGVDIGGTKIAAGLVGGDGTVVGRDRVPTPRTGGADVMAAVLALVRTVLAKAEAAQGNPAVTGIGVGAPGVIDAGSGRVLSATEVLPGWAGTDVSGALQAEFGLPVAVENDVRAAALGEALLGAGAGIARLLVVSLGTGVGGALVFDGVLQRGGHGTAGELAHLLTPYPGPIPCGCGRFDHLEAHACGPAMAAAYHRATGGSGDTPPLRTVVERWHAGDERAGRAITDAARLAGRAVAGLAVAVDVDAVVITGGVAAIGADLLSPLREAFRESAIGPLREIPVLPGLLGADAPVIGAASLTAHPAPAVGGSTVVTPANPGAAAGSAATRPHVPGSRWTIAAFAAAVRGTLIVSCQARDGHPLRDTPTIVRMARAAVAGGATAIRCGGYGGLADVAAVAAALDVPVIGLTKEGAEGVYITPTVASAVAVARAGAAVVALDATDRPRPDGSTVADQIAAVHAAGALAMADVSTLAEGASAARVGADLISTTLSGYTPTSPARPGPDLPLVAALRAALPDAVITAEGRYRTPDEAAAAVKAGADAVIVGTAITDPAWITTRFAARVRAGGAS